MKTIFNKLTIAVVLYVSSVYSFSQEIPDSLLKYLEIATGNNPAVLQRLTEYEAALKKIPQVGTLPDPQLDLGVFVSPMELIGGNQVADLRLMQMFPWFGVLKNARDEMSLMAKAKFELFRDAGLQVYFDVQRTWYELYKVREDIRISEKNIEILRIIERLSLIKYKAPPTGSSGSGNQPAGMQTQSNISVNSYAGSGMQVMGGNQSSQGVSTPKQDMYSMQPGSMNTSPEGSGLTDLYRIQIEAGELENSIAFLKTREQTIIARFNGYLNRNPVTKVYTDDILIQDTPDMDLLTVTDSVQNRNPMLNMLAYEEEAYLARKKMVTGMSYPMVGIGVNYSIIGRPEMSSSSMNGKDMIMPMVSVTLPVYRKKYMAMREEADLLSKASSLNYQATLNTLQTEYYAVVQLYHDAQRRTILYKNQYLLALKSLEIMMRSFSSSSASLTDVLRIRQQTLDYELRQVEAIVDLKTAEAWLNRLMASYKIY